MEEYRREWQPARPSMIMRTGSLKAREYPCGEGEVDRIRHVDVCNAQTGPIFGVPREMTGSGVSWKKTKRGEPEYDFTSEDGVRHAVFVIRRDADIAAIHEAFQGIDSIYIADGHHGGSVRGKK